MPPSIHPPTGPPGPPAPHGRQFAAPEAPACALSPPSASGPSSPRIRRSPHGHPLQTQAEGHCGEDWGPRRDPSPSPALCPERIPASMSPGVEGCSPGLYWGQDAQGLSVKHQVWGTETRLGNQTAPASKPGSPTDAVTSDDSLDLPAHWRTGCYCGWSSWL